VTTLGVGTLVVDDPGQPNAPFHLVDADNGDITVQTVETPEPATLALVGVGLGLMSIQRRIRR
jgi:hypothetical protein